MDPDDDSEYGPASSESGQPPQPLSLPSPRPGESIRKRRLKTVEPSPTVSLPKRQKGVFNFQYINILNEEIRDAAAGIIRDEPLGLAPAKIGIVSWTPSEKHVFFSALARLGRDDIAGIAARIGTKSPLEVQQYLVLLNEAERARRENDGKRQRALRPVDVPAAAELSTELCAALEQAADGIALRCERHETALEQKRWQGRWLVTAQLARLLERQQRSNRSNNNRNTAMAETNDLPPFAELFVLRNWLRLSERVFMNSSVVPDGNWRGVSEEPPSIRATALADFHSLALSVTRRLVSATLYVASSRVRAKRAGDRRNRTGGLVKIKDVQAAVASVGMTENSRKFWARAARRLRLDVYDDEQDDESEDVLGMTDQEHLSGNGEDDDEDLNTEAEDISESDTSEREEEEPTAPSEIDDNKTDTSSTSEPPPMPYDKVEAALGFPPISHPTQEFPADLPEISSTSSELSFSDSAPDSDSDSDSDIPMKDPPSPSPSPSPSSEEEDSPALAQDLHEALTYTAAYDRTTATRSRDALRARIRVEHELWADAERADAQAAGREEARLWRVVVHDGRGRVEVDEEDEHEHGEGRDEKGEGRPEMRRRSGLVDLGANWRDHVEYYSEWEVAGGKRMVAGGSNAKD
ncbi:hypothetical protein F4813DRAFT_356786 [Daldinia decipiens]|uniref:uncharacterized protein n=1 Tax=Daldinia decipiens TaxID=326647 RepID=UPI0020C54EA9|nr:uncharacterized protein F4813DRAFT_356786 [Daldinia decipiens]KAI1658430.1 hypothetical protein F4813DRAFT_356786 [Daldinia decipiens]